MKSDNACKTIPEKIIESARQHGEEVSRGEGATTISEAQLAFVAEGAKAIAREEHGPGYDPGLHPQDASREDICQTSIETVAELTKMRSYAKAKLREASIAQARQPPPGPEPRVPLILAFAMIVILAISVSPTIHDLLSSIEDPLVAWLVAGLVGLAIGGGVVAAIFHSTHSSPGSATRSTFQSGAVMGGIILGIALAFVRLSAVDGAGEWCMVIGLSLLEVSVVVMVERVARRLDADRVQWTELQRSYALAESERSAILDEVHNLDGSIQDQQDVVDAHLHYLDERSQRNFDLPAVEAAAAQAAREGYAAGVAHNRGWLLGAKRAS